MTEFHFSFPKDVQLFEKTTYSNQTGHFGKLHSVAAFQSRKDKSDAASNGRVPFNSVKKAKMPNSLPLDLNFLCPRNPSSCIDCRPELRKPAF
jgi:hypothetical protein